MVTFSFFSRFVSVCVCSCVGLRQRGRRGRSRFLLPSFLSPYTRSTVETPKHKLQAGKRRGRTEHPPLSLSSFSSSSSKPCDTLLNARALSPPPFSLHVVWHGSVVHGRRRCLRGESCWSGGGGPIGAKGCLLL